MVVYSVHSAHAFIVYHAAHHVLAQDSKHSHKPTAAGGPLVEDFPLCMFLCSPPLLHLLLLK